MDRSRLRARAESAAVAVFGLACLAGLAGAAAGIGVSSWSIDELITGWMIGSGGAAAGEIAARIATDVHPPLYYVLAAGYSRIFGSSDVAVRSLSALCAVGAVLIFVLANARSFSLAGRLFAAALATASPYWFYHSQDARSYGLVLLIGSALMALTLRMLRDSGGGPKERALLLALMLAGTFAHTYLFFLCVALLMLAIVHSRRERGFALLCLAIIVLCFAAYLQLVIKPHTIYSTTDGWIGGDFEWYRVQALETVRWMAGLPALAALALCAAMFVFVHFRRGMTLAEDPGRFIRRPLSEWIGPEALLCFGVPLLVAGGGIVSSIVMVPNVTTRNLLVCSPFLWGAIALLYDRGIGAARPNMRVGANLVLALLAVAAGTILLARWQPRNIPSREVIAWIRTMPECAGEQIPTLRYDRRSWAKPAFYDRMMPQIYDRYLQGFATVRIFLQEDIAAGRLAPDLVAELQARAGGRGCPVIGWSSAWVDGDPFPRVWQDLLVAIGRPQARGHLRVRKFAAGDIKGGGAAGPASEVLYFDRRSAGR